MRVTNSTPFPQSSILVAWDNDLDSWLDGPAIAESEGMLVVQAG